MTIFVFSPNTLNKLAAEVQNGRLANEMTCALMLRSPVF